ncbi:MAG: hypothetical protein CVU88_03505 [Firmicutes bacterium HGW-Firmicutes-13]|nr:MAG: hypothetical protein CVU88_03505 [Firmicutes bacterium HGW-Firmicutes-13]
MNGSEAMIESRLKTGEGENLNVLDLLEQLKKLLLYEREQIICLNIKELPELMAKKEAIIQALSSNLSEFALKIAEKEQQKLELVLREMLQINRGNVYLLQNYRRYQKKIAELLGLDFKAEELPYKSTKKSLKSRSLFDGQA